MNSKTAGAVGAVVLALLAAAWWQRDSAPMAALRHLPGLPGAAAPPTTTETLHAAGVHKCQTPGGILYVDAACPKGSRELAANGGSVTVMPFPKPVPSAPASDVLGRPLVQGMSPQERDRLRDKMIEDAANRK